ncbi:MAG TPA: gamma-glutamylcyclotransferase family protein [Acidimicrobiia bacterium]|nr:gamma-glutamylcyclotransferase family protein [Acidimicrobiia bacterium]
MHHVFVYGSLRRGGSAEHLLGNLERVVARLEAHALYGRNLVYPFAVPDPASSVIGEIVTLASDATLHRLDAYEGDEYRRTVARAVTAAGPLPAWVWVAALPESLPEEERIDSGDWFAR